MFYLLIITIIVIIIIFLYQSYRKYQKQKKRYNLALKVSKEKNKKLLVIGNPQESNTNFLFGSYGCGNICIDINGCICDEKYAYSKIIKDKIENVINKFEKDSVVIFESEVLEYIDEKYIDYVIEEMYRISGGDIFSVHELKPDNLLTDIKQKGYEFFNYLLGKKIFKYKRLFKSYPPFGIYKYVDI